jgi:hypothetical protein
VDAPVGGCERCGAKAGASSLRIIASRRAKVAPDPGGVAAASSLRVTLCSQLRIPPKELAQ